MEVKDGFWWCPTVLWTSSRSITEPEVVSDGFHKLFGRLKDYMLALDRKRGFFITDVKWVHGGAPGGDTLFEEKLRRLLGPTMPPTIEVIRPDNEKYHPLQAPLERNTVMVEKADVCLALWVPPPPGKSRKGGTFDTICKAAAKGIPTYVEIVNPQALPRI